MNGRAAATLACAVCVAACSLFVDTNELAGDDGSPASDAGPDTSTGGNTDTGVTPDAGNGPADAGPDVIAAEPCPTGTFCDDFERSTPQGAWSDIIATGGCSLGIDPTIAHRGASSLKNVLLKADQGGACSGHLYRGLPVTATKITVRFALRISATVPRDIHVMGVSVGSPNRVFFIFVNNTGPYLSEQQFEGTVGSDYYPLALNGFAPLTFHTFVVEHEISTKRTLVTMDGQPALDQVLVRSFAATQYGVTIGTNYSSPGDAVDLWFDDYRLLVE